MGEIASESLLRFISVIGPLGRPGELTPREGSQLLLALTEHLTDGAAPDMLKFASRFLTPDDYGEIVTERNIIHLCGYPLCNRDPKGMKSAHQINYRPNATLSLPASYLSKFCSKEHYQASAFYQSQLSDAPIFSRKDVTYLPYGTSDYELRTLLLEEAEQEARNSNSSMREVIEKLKGVHIDTDESKGEDDAFRELTNTIQQFSIIERQRKPEEDQDQDQASQQGNHRAIEGYSSRYA
uniref:RNA polymerase II subunit B1 CTD phosphatase RPAP2 homolog n=1 Tax=Blastobotrys adeninivorans TaxID=409370 RepID=A0A060T5E7_BLAAD